MRVLVHISYFNLKLLTFFYEQYLDWGQQINIFSSNIDTGLIG